MYKWLKQAYKGKPHELKNRVKTAAQLQTCFICGAPLKNGNENTCDSCKQFLEQEQLKERTAKNDY